MQAGWQQEMANSSSNVVREGDEGLQRRVKEYFVCKGGGLGLSYITCQTGEQIKKKKVQGNSSQSPGGGMMMLDGCAGLGEHGRKKDKSK
jgi:hypothetical protein